MSDTENWDDEFAIPITTSPRKLSLSSSNQDKRPLFSQHHAGGSGGDGEDDWSNDFEGGTDGMGGPATPQKKILGIKADSNAKEDWDDDFDFASESGSDDGKNIMGRNSLLTRTRSASHIRDGGSHNVEDLIWSIPSTKEIMAANPHISTSKPVPPPAALFETTREAPDDPDEYWAKQVKSREEKVAAAKAQKDAIAQSRAYWELGRIYQSHNKLVNAMGEFQHALQVIEDDRTAAAASAPAATNMVTSPNKGSAPASATSPGSAAAEAANQHAHYELELLFQLGMTAKAMADIFQQTDYLEKARVIAQADRRFLPQYTQISLELGLAHLVTENPRYALRSFEAYLRCLLRAHTSTGPGAGVDLTRVDWAAVAVGCYHLGTTLRLLSQERGAPTGSSQQEAQDNGALAREFFMKAEEIAGVVGDKDTQNAARTLVDHSSLPISRRASNAQALLQNAEKIKADLAKAKHVESEEEEEDWDAELGITSDEGEDRPALQLPGQLFGVASSKAKLERIPLKHRLFEAVSSQTFEIVKFPKPTFLYTLTTQSGHTFMHEEELEQWLKGVISRHTRGETSHVAQHARERLPFPELLSYYSTKIAKV